MLSNLWTTVLLPLLTSYGATILFALGLAIVLSIFTILIAILPSLISFIKSLAEKNLSEKVSSRINDAMNKFESVLVDILTLQQNKMKQMAKEAFENDGKIDMKEVKEIASEMAKIAMERMSPDIATFKKYITGDAVFEYIQDKFAAVITQSVEKFINDKLLSQIGKK
jgi:ABC-type transport system involved in cytochrome bd biosynthesis fused ATPase/permease subunit